MTRSTLALFLAAMAATLVLGCNVDDDPQMTGSDAGITPMGDGGPAPVACEDQPATRDTDGDGYCPAGRDGNVDGDCCDTGEGLDPAAGDCNDDARAISPLADELCGNGVDEDCGESPCATPGSCPEPDALDPDCNPAAHECDEDSECADGSFCTVNVRCADHRCIAGTPRVCDDGNASTADSCNEATDRCDYTPLPSCTSDGACSDGLFCNGTERCVGGACVAGTTVSCDDGNPRTTDSCNEAADRCNNVPVAGCLTDAECGDDLFCNGIERCNGVTGTCQAGTAPSCTHGCNEASDICNPAPAGCTSDAACSNGLYCDGVERCSGGSCVSGTAPDCNDGSASTADSCNEASDVCNHTTITECAPLTQTRGCTTSCGGAMGTQVCQADGRWPTSCPPPAELCTNSVDDDCDGTANEGCVTTTYYRDADGDGYGRNDVTVTTPTSGYVTASGDCNDSNASVHPGAADVCPSDGIDNDCVGGDMTACGSSCTMTDTVTVRVGSPGSSGYRISYNMEDRTCSREYRYVDDSTGVIETSRESRDGVYMIQVQQSSSGQWFSYMETSTPFSPIFLRTGWAVSIQVNSATCTLPSIPSGGYTPPTTIAPGACEPCYDSSGWPNVCVNTSSSTRELRCNDGVDNDADGRTDGADEDCGRWS